MPSQAAGKVRQGDRDAEVAQRAARRIGEYLTTHPGADPAVELAEQLAHADLHLLAAGVDVELDGGLDEVVGAENLSLLLTWCFLPSLARASSASGCA